MKKILCVLLMALCLTACAGTPTVEQDQQAPEKEVLVMATEATFEPYEFYDGDTIVGIDVEIAKAIGEKLGKEVEVVDIAFDSIIPGVQTGKYDFGMAGMTVTEERLKEINFSDSYATGVQVIIVNEDSAITTVDDLFADGAYNVVGTQTGTTGYLYATWDIAEAEPSLGEVKDYAKTTDAAQALVNKQIDCIMLDNEPAKAIVAKNPGLKILDSEYAIEDYAIAISKENEALLNDINGALNALKADGTIDAIVKKYIGE